MALFIRRPNRKQAKNGVVGILESDNRRHGGNNGQFPHKNTKKRAWKPAPPPMMPTIYCRPNLFHAIPVVTRWIGTDNRTNVQIMACPVCGMRQGWMISADGRHKQKKFGPVAPDPRK